MGLLTTLYQKRLILNVAQYRVRLGENAVQPQKAQKPQIVFLCRLWPFPVYSPLPNFARGSLMYGESARVSHHDRE